MKPKTKREKNHDKWAYSVIFLTFEIFYNYIVYFNMCINKYKIYNIIIFVNTHIKVYF